MLKIFFQPKRMKFETTFLITAFLTSTMGSVVRIAQESEEKRITLKKGLLIYLCSLVTGYCCFEAARSLQWSWMVGVPSLVLALIAMEITAGIKNSAEWVVERIIREGVSMFIEAGRRFFNLPPNDKK